MSDEEKDLLQEGLGLIIISMSLQNSNLKLPLLLRGTKFLFCGCGLHFFVPPRGSNSKTTHLHVSPDNCFVFYLNTLKGTVKTPDVELSRLNKLGGTKPTFKPQKVQREPPFFYN